MTTEAPFNLAAQRNGLALLRTLLDAVRAKLPTVEVPIYRLSGLVGFVSKLIDESQRMEDELLQLRTHRDQLVKRAEGLREGMWIWQHDGYDHPESITCPILISPDHLRSLIAGDIPEAKDAAKS